MRIPKRPPSYYKLIDEIPSDKLVEILEKVPSPLVSDRYMHWDEIRHRPVPPGLTHEQMWAGLKIRRSVHKAIPLTDSKNQPFTFNLPEQAQALLHEITQRTGGSIGAPDQLINENTRNQYLIRNLMEEGITSSMIEGAATTRKDAKQMLRSGRTPKNEHEQMVINNYRAMQYIIDLERQPLKPNIIFHLHHLLTENTLDNPSAAGRLRNANEKINVVDESNGDILHQPPHADLLPQRLQAMCDFANGKTPKGFIHPVVRSIILHFWLAYDHPFIDGNGRCARALFYWSMIQHDYWLCEFISISRLIYKAMVQYGRAFLYTETDDNDLTYFIFHQLNIIKKALDDLYKHINDTASQKHDLEVRLRMSTHFNTRQLDLLTHALTHPNAQYSIKAHQTAHDTVYQTARTDLLGLADKGLLQKFKSGRTWMFTPAPDLDQKLKSWQSPQQSLL